MKVFTTSILLSLLVAFIILTHSIAQTSEDTTPLVPALYVFGDSLFDAGNNPVGWPYGVDLDPSLKVNPRFTNGKTVADYIATWLGLPLVPPYNNHRNSTTGINFAFGGSAILPENMPINAANFDLQITQFKSAIHDHLSSIFGPEVIDHLHNSVFLISYPINDYVTYINYVKRGFGPEFEPVLYSKYLLGSFSERLTRLYRMGARKFIITNIWPLGCSPMYNNDLQECNDTVNDIVTPYKDSMPGMLQQLASDLEGFKFSYSDDFNFFDNIYLHTYSTGITNVFGKCWQNVTIPLCKDRDMYLYFDNLHPTEAANRLFALNCFNGSNLCSPVNIMELVRD